MGKNRLEAFSDGVLAIIITIMVLELKIPHGADWTTLKNMAPKFLSYVISFIYIAIYWNNHHHLLYTVKKVDGSILWANIHLLFWLSLVPFATAWSGENNFAHLPVAVYGAVLLLSAVAYYILSRVIISRHGSDSILSLAVGKDAKGILSIVLYAAAIPIAFFSTFLSMLIYWTVAVIWLIPDRRIEQKLKSLEEKKE